MKIFLTLSLFSVFIHSIPDMETSKQEYMAKYIISNVNHFFCHAPVNDKILSGDKTGLFRY